MRKSDPNSNRSKKRQLRHALQQNEPNAVIVAASEYRKREHAKDGRKRDYLKDSDVPELLGQKEQKFYPYRPTVTFEEVLHEAYRLHNEYTKTSITEKRFQENEEKFIRKTEETLTIRDFINSAYLNCSATSWQAKITHPTRISKVCKEWLQSQKKCEPKSEFKPRLIKH